MTLTDHSRIRTDNQIQKNMQMDFNVSFSANTNGYNTGRISTDISNEVDKRISNPVKAKSSQVRGPLQKSLSKHNLLSKTKVANVLLDQDGDQNGLSMFSAQEVSRSSMVDNFSAMIPQQDDLQGTVAFGGLDLTPPELSPGHIFQKSLGHFANGESLSNSGHAYALDRTANKSATGQYSHLRKYLSKERSQKRLFNNSDSLFNFSEQDQEKYGTLGSEAPESVRSNFQEIIMNPEIKEGTEIFETLDSKSVELSARPFFRKPLISPSLLFDNSRKFLAPGVEKTIGGHFNRESMTLNTTEESEDRGKAYQQSLMTTFVPKRFSDMRKSQYHNN